MGNMTSLSVHQSESNAGYLLKDTRIYADI